MPSLIVVDSREYTGFYYDEELIASTDEDDFDYLDLFRMLSKKLPANIVVWNIMDSDELNEYLECNSFPKNLIAVRNMIGDIDVTSDGKRNRDEDGEGEEFGDLDEE